MRSAQQGNKDIRFTLFDNPDFTGNANAVCDYTITGTFDIDGGAINQPYTTIMAQNDHNHTYDTGSNITGFTITSVVPVCPCVLVIFNQITPTPTLTPTNTPTNTPSITPTQTPSNTPTMTPTTPELCECWEIVNTDGIDISMRYYNCQGAEDCVIIDATSSRIVCISANTDTLIIVSSGTTCGGGAPPSYTWNPLGTNCTVDNDCLNPPPSSTPTSTPTITSTPSPTPCIGCELWRNTTFETLEIDYQSCEGVFYVNELLPSFGAVCIVPGTGGGTDWAQMQYESSNCGLYCP
jgi:hypothetical protein